MALGMASRMLRSAFSESWKTMTEPLRVYRYTTFNTPCGVMCGL